MMLVLCLAAMSAPAIWYGPATVQFNSKVAGNPYDLDSANVVAVFDHNGKTETRPAYYDGEHWEATYVSDSAGPFTAHLENGGVSVSEETERGTLKPGGEQGFVRLGGPWGFRFDDGETYWPIGHNLAWGGAGVPPLPDALRQMKTYGANWARIWADAWDGKNPWWHKATPELPEGGIDPEVARKWDDIVKGAEEGGVHFQFVLFHHGCFSSNVNPNWPDNPWNKANGGFLAKPDDFFTDPKAKKYAKQWIRYAVARWGHSPAIMSWELFNEVQWCDASRNNPAAVFAWHKEMSDYLRSIDPYHHLITTSSELHPEFSPSIDYWQPHGYPPSVGAMVAAFDLPKDHPAFYGEVGIGGNGGDSEFAARHAIRDAIYESLFHHHAGSAQYWYWDKVYPLKLQNEWATATTEIAAVKPFERPGWKATAPKILATATGSMTLIPGGGWEPFKVYDYSLPADAGKMGGFSTYFQGTGHKDMRSQPVTFRFTASKSGQMTVRIDQVSDSGGALVVKVNGETVLTRQYAGKDQSHNSPVAFQVPMGHDVVQIDNTGPDWLQIGAVSIPGIGLPVKVDGASDGQIELLRATRANGATDRFDLAGLAVPDGSYRLTTTNLDTGNHVFVEGQIKNGQWQGDFDYKAQDMLLRFEPRTQ